MVFAVQDSGFYPRSALEYDDAAQNRLDKILSLIEECRFGIHDLSRTEPSREGLPRFNMPLELGLFLGCKRFGGEPHPRKACLVLDRDRYRFQRFISDIAGQDIHAHGGDPRKAVREVSGWLRTTSRRKRVPGGAAIWSRFERFSAELPELCRELEIEEEELTFVDRSRLIGEWLRENAPIA
jgi:hypothetical protein